MTKFKRRLKIELKETNNMFDLLGDVPIFWAKIIAVITFSAGILWTWMRPKSYIFNNAPDKKNWRDLRIWITVIMIIQIAVYLYF